MMTQRPINRVEYHVARQLVLSVNITTLRLLATPTMRRTGLKPSALNTHVTPTAHAWRQTRPRVLTRLSYSQPATTSDN